MTPADREIERNARLAPADRPLRKGTAAGRPAGGIESAKKKKAAWGASNRRHGSSVHRRRRPGSDRDRI
jgi:hypothetical protein